MQKPKRNTELSAAEREALDSARRILAPYFAGQSLKVYVPTAPKSARVNRIVSALQGGGDLLDISRTECVSLRWVRTIRRRSGTIPP